MKVLAWVEEDALAKVREADPVAAEVLPLVLSKPAVVVVRFPQPSDPLCSFARGLEACAEAVRRLMGDNIVFVAFPSDVNFETLELPRGMSLAEGLAVEVEKRKRSELAASLIADELEAVKARLKIARDALEFIESVRVADSTRSELVREAVRALEELDK